MSFERSASVLKAHRWILALPQGTDLTPFQALRSDIEARFFPPEFFVSKRAAQLFYMHPLFFEAFRDFDYILIHQPDVYVFRDELIQWVDYATKHDLDYIGAPWLDHQWIRFARHPLARLPWRWIFNQQVGSGGFSLRRVATFATASRRWLPLIKLLAKFLPEDAFWCQIAPYLGIPIRRPVAEVALRFAFETQCQECLQINGGRLPFAVHGWNRHDWDFWEEKIPGAKEIYRELAANGVRPL